MNEPPPQVAIDQGWTDETLLMLLWEFLKEQKLAGKAIEYLELVASEENASKLDI